MREILFRAKSKYGNEWVYGVPIPEEHNTRKTDEYAMADTVNYDELDGYNPSYYFEPIKKETIGQYTGLTDKNGKKIFEGDILHQKRNRVYGLPFSVAYNDGAFMWCKGERSDFLYQSICDACEIIGSIHDNPELLRRGK